MPQGALDSEGKPVDVELYKTFWGLQVRLPRDRSRLWSQGGAACWRALRVPGAGPLPTPALALARPGSPIRPPRWPPASGWKCLAACARYWTNSRP